jgi:hypothetical protein
VGVALLLAALPACEPPAGASVERCSTRGGGIFGGSSACTYVIPVLDSAGYTYFHRNDGLGSSSAYTDAVQLDGSLAVASGAATVEVTDEGRTVRRYIATAHSPVTFSLKMKTTSRIGQRGLQFALVPTASPARADSVTLTFRYAW